MLLRLCLTLLLLLPAALAGCTSYLDPDTGERVDCGGGPLACLLSATAADAEAAYRLAEAAGDESGKRCWATVKTVAEESQGPAAIAVIGPLSAWQTARNVRMGLEDGIDQRVRRDCAVLVLDALRTGRRLAGQIAPLL